MSGAAAFGQPVLYSRPQLSVVNRFLVALLRAPASERPRAAAEALAAAGIAAGVVDGRLVFREPVDPELAASLANAFALGSAADTRTAAVPMPFADPFLQTAKLAAIGELARGVAHEINNPLFAILGLTEFLLREIEPGTKAHARLTLVHDTGLELKEIVRALLDFARESADAERLVDLGDTIAQILELVRRTSSAKDVELVERISEQAAVRASANRLKQILLNLLTNAAQALPGGGTVTVGLVRDGHWAVVTVADTGPGLPDELEDRIFEPFFTTKGGTGLGLAVSRALAELQGGTLEIGSGGAGATFVLRLPLAQEAA
jgi:signal transduction histidine kinase